MCTTYGQLNCFVYSLILFSDEMLYNCRIVLVTAFPKQNCCVYLSILFSDELLYT